MDTRTMTRLAAFALAVVCSATAWSSTSVNWSATSPENKVHVVELFTSQGCSSCPPADRWLLEVAQAYPDFQRVIPLAFHVTYWDQLGWRDDFAQKPFDARQRAMARRENTGVYTPGMFLNGREWRTWRQGASLPLPERVGVLSFERVERDTHFKFMPVGTVTNQLQLHTAFLTRSASTPVRRGENRGRELTEGYLVSA